MQQWQQKVADQTEEAWPVAAVAVVEGWQKGEDNDSDNEEECKRLKSEANVACQRVGWLYDALVKLAKCHTLGDYKEFVKFLLMGVGA